MDGAFLRAAAQSAEATIEVIRLVQRQLQVAMFAAGVKDLAALQHAPLKEVGEHSRERIADSG